MKNISKFENSQTHMFTSFPSSHQDEDMEKLLENDQFDQQSQITQMPELADEKSYSFWQIEFYQKYFNVNTSDVISRIIGSMTPTLSQSFLLNRIRPNPDLYGPFWISMTLIFTISITGNIVNFLNNFGSSYTWHTDFNKLTSSAAIIITYWWLMPTILSLIIRWRKLVTEITFIEILSVYGYSLAVYIPVSILWLIKIAWLQWILVIVAVFLSANVLAFTFWSIFSQEENQKIKFVSIITIILLHALLGISIMFFFFNNPYPNLDPSVITTTSSVTFQKTPSTMLESALEKIDSKLNNSTTK